MVKSPENVDLSRYAISLTGDEPELVPIFLEHLPKWDSFYDNYLPQSALLERRRVLAGDMILPEEQVVSKGTSQLRKKISFRGGVSVNIVGRVLSQNKWIFYFYSPGITIPTISGNELRDFSISLDFNWDPRKPGYSNPHRSKFKFGLMGNVRSGEDFEGVCLGIVLESELPKPTQVEVGGDLIRIDPPNFRDFLGSIDRCLESASRNVSPQDFQRNLRALISY